MLKIGIVANEPSGDLLGSALVKAIREQVPDVEFEGVAGPLMLAQGCRSFFPMEKLTVMGLVEVLKHLPELLSLRKRLFNHFSENPPDLFIGIDAPDFNLPLERMLKDHGIRTVHYVSPTVWAWRPKRVKKIRKAVDLMLSIFPFEVDFLKQNSVPVEYVGHPLADDIPLENDRAAARHEMGLEGDAPVVAILPGSRVSEIKGLAEVFLRTAQLLHKGNPNLRFIVPLINDRTQQEFEHIKADIAPDLSLTIQQGAARQAMVAADVVLTASGTATLEALLVKRPMVVAYRLNAFTHWIVKRFNLVKVSYVAMANLLADEALAPEFIQDAATPEALAEALTVFLNEPERVAHIEQRYRQLHQTLKQNSGEKAAAAVLGLLRGDV